MKLHWSLWLYIWAVPGLKGAWRDLWDPLITAALALVFGAGFEWVLQRRYGTR